MINKSNIGELTIEQKDFRVTIKQKEEQVTQYVTAPVQQHAPVHAAAPQPVSVLLLSSRSSASASRLVGGNSRTRRFRGADWPGSLGIVAGLWQQALLFADIRGNTGEHALKFGKGLTNVNAIRIHFQFADRFLVLAAPFLDHGNGSPNFAARFEEPE